MSDRRRARRWDTAVHATAHVYPTREHPTGHLMVPPALERAQALAVLVRDEDATSIARILDPLTRQDIYALVTVMAALIPDDQPVAQLTAWVHRHVNADLSPAR